jgi:hypothetical protein
LKTEQFIFVIELPLLFYFWYSYHQFLCYFVSLWIWFQSVLLSRQDSLWFTVIIYHSYAICVCCRSQWPRGLRRRSAAARLLRSWFRIPPGAWMSVVSVVCCQVEVSATSWPLVQKSPTDCGASLCVIQKSHLRGVKHQSWLNIQIRRYITGCISCMPLLTSQHISLKDTLYSDC